MKKAAGGPIPQHKRLAMGEPVRLARGGLAGIEPSVARPLKTGIPDTPLENARRANSIPGLKHGGKARDEDEKRRSGRVKDEDEKRHGGRIKDEDEKRRGGRVERRASGGRLTGSCR